MAITKIHAIKTTLNKALTYIQNPNKTQENLLIYGYNVDPQFASTEFEMTAALAREIKGDYTKTGGSNNLAYHMIQSFSPDDNITNEQAHEIGNKLANEFLEGKYEYVISTHIDKGHIHNHIIFNAVSFYDYKKINTQPYKTVAKIRSISDRLCNEYELSVIKEKGDLAYSYAEYKARKQNISWKSEIRKRLNYLLETEIDYDKFKLYAKELGVTIIDTGKYIKYKMEGQERNTRGNKLATTNKYTKDGIIEQLKNNKENQKYIKNAIAEIAKEANDYNSFVELMEKRKSITIQRERSGIISYNIVGENNAKVKEIALGNSHSSTTIKKAISDKNYNFNEQQEERNISYEYNSNEKNKTKNIDTRIILHDENISKINVDGILLKIPNNEKTNSKIFIDNTHINYIKKTGQYEIYIDNKSDYYFVNETINPDISEAEQLSSQCYKGETIIRKLEILNKVKPEEIEVGAVDIKRMGHKGITISIPEMGIGSIFIENKYLDYDKTNSGTCKVSIYENWNYNYHSIDEEGKEFLKYIKGREIIKILKEREISKDNSLLNKIVALERKIKLEDAKILANTLLIMRKEKITTITDFDLKIGELQASIKEIKNNIKLLEAKNTQYKDVAKYLLAVKKYKPIIDGIEKQNIFSRKSYLKKNESEILAYNHAITQLEKLNVNASVEPEKVLALINEQDKNIVELRLSFKEVENKITQIRQAKNIVEAVGRNENNIVRDREHEI